MVPLIALRLPMEAALVGKVQRGVERVRFCVVFLSSTASLVTKFCPFNLFPYNQTQIITSSAGALIFVATQPRKKPAIIIGVANRIVQKLPMEGALPMIWDPAGASWRKVTTEAQDQN